MTEAERHREMGRSVERLASRRRQLACLQAKKKRLGDLIQATHRQLFEAGDRWLERHRGEVEMVHQQQGRDEVDDQPLEWPDKADLWALFKEIREAESEIEFLTTSLSDMGINLK